jgi:hypothetical protein
MWFWGLLLIDKDILVIIAQAVNPHGRRMRKECIVFLNGECDSDGGGYSFPAVSRERGIGMGSKANFIKLCSGQEHLNEGVGGHAGGSSRGAS